MIHYFHGNNSKRWFSTLKFDEFDGEVKKVFKESMLILSKLSWLPTTGVLYIPGQQDKTVFVIFVNVYSGFARYF